LFVGPIVSNVDAYLGTLEAVAKYSQGELHLALIPHPEKWKKAGAESAMFWE
jgi:hypothetical protein